ncbi:MAG: ABC transporter ATP-binding protein [Comamonas sp.]|jgi:biotin transport system ATP-binding protein|uniref:energy-coupling factor ABC transporter ATP-binding protein n=1 Tax=Comamonas denitrificans TaxID=117506 RepID=UPI001B57B8C2|nr:ABC transporter ATP-binding protein [Comamonas sp.]MCZ2107518.1 energy-coupling factor ABC transporter ATP-binding protein [Burkholderiales bacterium]HRL38750.1 ABC transporter ATP-binding protein [Comamonas denitrificans]MBP7931923.1 ABC transporter ATP-binding protein [Comamonas sp.]MBP7941109.1 ABC transporter ATP-binding protein [Comamonas sp.]
MTMQGWELQDIHLRRGQTPVFAGLHLQLHEARIGLIGFNGAGKTSLLRMLAGLDVPQQGRIVRQGETLHSAERGHAPSRRVGLMFQNPDDQIIFPTVQEELQLSWRSAHPGSSRAQAAQAVADFLQQRGLAHWAERAVGSLSQGQRQWVCWLAMRVAQPEVLLLDEPYASLDLPGQLRLAADIAACPQQVLVSTHVLDYVRDYPRVLWLEQGQLRLDGPGQQVCAAYEAHVRGLGIDQGWAQHG